MNSSNFLFVLLLIITSSSLLHSVKSLNKNLGRSNYHETGLGLYVQSLLENYSERFEEYYNPNFSNSYGDYFGLTDHQNDYLNFIIHSQ